MIQGKVWGETVLLLKTPFVEIHSIHIKPHSQCSMHKHDRKWNAFYVIDGKLEIHTEKSDYNLVDVTVLQDSEFTTVKPGEFHKFVTKEYWVHALEIYYLEPITEDIIRRDVGSSATE